MRRPRTGPPRPFRSHCEGRPMQTTPAAPSRASARVTPAPAPTTDRFDPEEDVLACLLCLDAAHARAIPTLMQPDALADPALAELLTTITLLASNGVAPEPSAV